MKRNFVDLAGYRAELRARDGKPPENLGIRAGSSDGQASPEANSRKIRFCFSDGSVDRASDTIDPEGWVVDGFNKNPVALWAHDSSQPPIGRASDVSVENKLRLMGTIEFASAEVNPLADTAFRLILAGFLNAVSVGFLPLELEWSDDEERPWGIDFLKQELLEISVVPIPCNANALVDARSKGIDTAPLVKWAEKELDGGCSLLVPRSELEALRKAAKPPLDRRRKMVAARARKDDEAAASESDPAAGGDTVEVQSMGDCGKPADEECGMKDATQCATHAPMQDDDAKRVGALLLRVARGIKAGRVLSAANEKDLRDAYANHAKAAELHAEAMEAHKKAGEHNAVAAACIKAVLDRHDDATADDQGDDDASSSGDGTGGDDKSKRRARVAALRRLAGAA